MCELVKYGFSSQLLPQQLFWRTKKQAERNDVRAALDESASGFLFGKVK